MVSHPHEVRMEIHTVDLVAMDGEERKKTEGELQDAKSWVTLGRRRSGAFPRSPVAPLQLLVSNV